MSELCFDDFDYDRHSTDCECRECTKEEYFTCEFCNDEIDLEDESRGDHKCLEKENTELKAKVERLETAVWATSHDEFSKSPEWIEDYFCRLYAGNMDAGNKATMERCKEGK
jgi:hypothetical protein